MENSSNCKLLLGDCIDRMKELAENSVDSIVTDSPYGLRFMNKSWDYDVPCVAIWKEALRVLKPGGHLLSFGGTRTYHRMVVNIEDAGFEIRDCIQWLYGSGFPKSHNIKEGEFKGWGTALKPANEPICMARKPLEKGLTVAENVLKYRCGAINIDESRIGFSNNETDSRIGTSALSKGSEGKAPFGEKKGGEAVSMYKEGRWPANIILDEDAAQMLDEQSGVLKSGELKGYKSKESENVCMSGKNYEREFTKTTKSEGGASRFFYVAKASKSERNAGLEGASERICGSFDGNIDHEHGNRKIGAPPNIPTAKAKNHHPTVKPIKLMQYLINLVTPPQGTVLDPFMGSGSTGVAAKNLNRKFIGIELNEEYFEIAKNRINKLQLELSE